MNHIHFFELNNFCILTFDTYFTENYLIFLSRRSELAGKQDPLPKRRHGCPAGLTAVWSVNT